MSDYLLVLSGPNLSMLGTRDPEVYGTSTLDELVAATTLAAGAHGLGIRHVQSNHEGELIDVHLSNPAAREPFRHVSVIAPVVAGSIAGFGPLSYELAVQAIVALLEGAPGTTA